MIRVVTTNLAERRADRIKLQSSQQLNTEDDHEQEQNMSIHLIEVSQNALFSQNQE